MQHRYDFSKEAVRLGYSGETLEQFNTKELKRTRAIAKAKRHAAIKQARQDKAIKIEFYQDLILCAFGISLVFTISYFELFF